MLTKTKAGKGADQNESLRVYYVCANARFDDERIVCSRGDRVPGSPSATSPIGERQIPPSPATFGGTINVDAQNSTPYWQPSVVANLF